MYKIIFNFGVIICCIVLLQYHSIRFWSEQIGLIGLAWSVLLELVNFWLWLTRRQIIYYVLGTLTALILLVGPLYETSQVLFRENSVSSFFQTDLQNKEKDLSDTIAQRDKLSNLIGSGRIGYRDDYRKAAESVNNLRQSISDIGKTKSQSRQSWQTYLIVVIQAIAICIFNLVIILAILSLDIRVNVARAVKNIVKEIRWRIETLEKSRSLSIEEIAKRINVNMDIMNHIHSAEGSRRFSQETAEKILERIKRV